MILIYQYKNQKTTEHNFLQDLPSSNPKRGNLDLNDCGLIINNLWHISHCRTEHTGTYTTPTLRLMRGPQTLDSPKESQYNAYSQQWKEHSINTPGSDIIQVQGVREPATHYSILSRS